MTFKTIIERLDEAYAGDGVLASCLDPTHEVGDGLAEFIVNECREVGGVEYHDHVGADEAQAMVDALVKAIFELAATANALTKIKYELQRGDT